MTCFAAVSYVYTLLQAGAVAGLSVDLMFYPIDTIKTRLQSQQGFVKAGGFKGIYKGVGSVGVGSAPGGESGSDPSTGSWS